MTTAAIRVNGLSKKYRIGGARQRHDTLRDALTAVFRRTNAGAEGDDYWALKDVSFEIKRGEVVGIIGRNGAGKSTLLKILSQITEPTEGEAMIYGRVGSLLEVGTGFHPELSGRENIYLNGAMLGMRRAEITRRFDSIVEFSEIGAFLDTPVKRYSSGMYVRLAFAVAAHLDPEILLVDEVLAVGDMAFQKKALGKMGSVVKEGRTVLFVSHNMAAISSLCHSAIRIDKGRIVDQGSARTVVLSYVNQTVVKTVSSVRNGERLASSDTFRFVDLRLLDADSMPVNMVVSGQDVQIELLFEAHPRQSMNSAVMSLAFYSMMGQSLFLCRSDYTNTEYTAMPSEGAVTCRIARLPLAPGEYVLNLYCEINGQVVDWVESAATITVGEGDFYGTGRLPSGRGDLLVAHEWSGIRSRSDNGDLRA